MLRSKFAAVELLDTAHVGPVVYLDPPEKILANDLVPLQLCHSRRAAS